MDKEKDNDMTNHPRRVSQAQVDVFAHNSRRNSTSMINESLKSILHDCDSINTKTPETIRLIMKKAGIDSVLIDSVVDAQVKNYKVHKEILKVLRSSNNKSNSVLAQEIVAVYRINAPELAMNQLVEEEKICRHMSTNSLHLKGCFDCCFYRSELKRQNSSPDRIQSNSDRIQSNPDRIQSNSGRIQSNSDRIQSNSGRIQSNSDLIHIDFDLQPKTPNPKTPNPKPPKKEDYIRIKKELGCIFKCFSLNT
jgi:hypothetical protein